MTQRSSNVPKDGLLAHHTKQELLNDMHWHLEEAMMHLSHHRYFYPDSPADPGLMEIEKHLRISLSYLAFGDLEEEEEANG